MKLSSYLQPEFIKIGIPVKNYEEAINFLVSNLEKYLEFELNKDEVIKNLYEREKLSPTVLDKGIWLPHIRLDGLKDHIITICIPEKPFIYSEKEVRLIILIITSKTNTNIYLNTLSGIGNLALKEEEFNKLLNSKMPQDVINIIKNNDINLKKEIVAEDIMTKDIISLSPDMTIKDAADLFCKYHTSYLPVIDNNGNFIGEVGTLDLIKLGLPDYVTQIGNLKFLKSFEPFEWLLNNEDKIKVVEIMKKPEVSCEPDTSIIEVALLLTNSKKRHIPVIKDKKIVGVISFMDILEKVIRG